MSDSKDKAGDTDGNFFGSSHSGKSEYEDATASDADCKPEASRAYADNVHNNNLDPRTSTSHTAVNNEPAKGNTFAIQLMNMMTNEVDSSRGAVEWIYDGSGFVITNQKVFEEEIIRRYFAPCSFQSFMRRLYRYVWKIGLILSNPKSLDCGSQKACYLPFK